MTKLAPNESQTTIAKTGQFEIRGNHKKILDLYDGKSINNRQWKNFRIQFLKNRL
jgi:hypothetical protein